MNVLVVIDCYEDACVYCDEGLCTAERVEIVGLECATYKDREEEE